ncbi:MAG: FAD-binding protein [Myxococcales bacterium]|nr:FAD-binding protein [Myxococcales bacterium]
MALNVLVIGGGVAGVAAAVTARSLGASVTLVARGPGATALSSGAADFRQHPWLPQDAVDDGLRFVRGLGYAGDGNLWLLSPLGCPKRTVLAQPFIAAGDLKALPKDARPAVVALCGSQAIEARLQAKGLAKHFPKAFALPVELYVHRSDALRTIPEIAADLDQPGRRTQLTEALRRAVRASGATHLYLPTLGYAPEPIDAGVPVYEMLSAPPSVPGIRLQRALEKSIDIRGGIVERRPDGGVQIISGTSCEPLEAHAVVLATGRFIGGGIRSDDRLRETVFDLPVWAGDRQKLVPLPTEELFSQKASGRHVGLTAGLRNLEYGKVFAAGAVVGGYDQSRDEGGLVIAAVLGVRAGRAAVRFVQNVQNAQRASA